MDSFQSNMSNSDFTSSSQTQTFGLARQKRTVGRPRKLPSSGINIPSESNTDINNPSSSPNGQSRLASLEAMAKREQRNSEREDGARLPLPQRRLSPEIKHRIVELVATFHTVKQVQDIVAAEHNVALTDTHVNTFNPDRANCGMGKKLRAYFDQVRERYVSNASAVAISHQTHRLRRLEAISDAALQAKDFGNAIKALEIAAKEMGGLLEAGNAKLTVEHKGTVGHVHATVDEAKAEVAMRLRGLVDKLALPVPPEPEPVTDPDTWQEQDDGDSGVIDGDVIDIIE